MAKYVSGQHVFILASNCIVQELEVRSSANHVYTLALEQSGLIQMPEERIFSSRKSAEDHMDRIRKDRKKRPSYLERISAKIL